MRKSAYLSLNVSLLTTGILLLSFGCASSEHTRSLASGSPSPLNISVETATKELVFVRGRTLHLTLQKEGDEAAYFCAEKLTVEKTSSVETIDLSFSNEVGVASPFIRHWSEKKISLGLDTIESGRVSEGSAFIAFSLNEEMSESIEPSQRDPSLKKLPHIRYSRTLQQFAKTEYDDFAIELRISGKVTCVYRSRMSQ